MEKIKMSKADKVKVERIMADVVGNKKPGFIIAFTINDENTTNGQLDCNGFGFSNGVSKAVLVNAILTTFNLEPFDFMFRAFDPDKKMGLRQLPNTPESSKKVKIKTNGNKR